MNIIREYIGKIFEIDFQIDGLHDLKTSLGLVISDARDNDNVRLVLIDYKKGDYKLPYDLLSRRVYLDFEKNYFLPSSCLKKELCKLSDELFQQVYRQLIHYEVKNFYFIFHKLNENRICQKDKIKYAGRIYDENELINLVDASLDFWLTAGNYAHDFEDALAQYLGVKHCSLVNSGSSANLLAFMALTSPMLGERRLCRGDEIITTAVCFPTTVSPIVHYGCIPVFVDVDLPSYNIDCSKLESALSAKTKAVIVAHTMGNPFDIAKVKEFCDQNELWLVEDNCDALGAKFYFNGQWKYTGTIGDIGTSSFYPAHHITTGEGGAIYTNNIQLKRIIDSLRDWGRDCWCSPGSDNTCGNRFTRRFGELPVGYDHKYVYSHFGFNLKLTEMQAAIGFAQLQKLSQFIAIRNSNWQKLYDGLIHLNDKLILPKATRGAIPSWFGFLITVREDAGFTRNDLVKYLEESGIQTRMLFAGNIIKHPCFDILKRESAYRVVGDLRNTDLVLNNSFWLGVYPGITSSDIDYIVSRINRFCNGL